MSAQAEPTHLETAPQLLRFLLLSSTPNVDNLTVNNIIYKIITDL